jgi:hypothetical protein
MSTAECGERCRYGGAFGEPELIPINPEPVVQLAVESFATHGTAMGARTLGIEFEEHAVPCATTSFPR